VTFSEPSEMDVNVERAEPGPRSRLRRQGPGRKLFVILGVAIVVAGVFATIATRYRHQHEQLSSIRATGIPASVPTSLANLMALSPIPASAAPGFTLRDQTGRTISLASFKGRTVVLEFMDPHCVDICPIVSQEFVDAYRNLGTAARQVVFVAVNVNPYHVRVAEMAQFSREHGLETIPSWHFLTGTVSSLRAVWHDYGVDVHAPNPNADVIHSAFVYFIDPHGHERYIGSPMADHNAQGGAFLPADQIASWGRGISLVARDLVK
jgi:cytochrome oxidase Cu insertion factor (SCO1/SenC/PrrC family)